MKNGVYGIKSFSFADCVENGGYPTAFENTLKAIVSGSLTFNDQAAQTSDVEIEDSEDPYAVLVTSAATKGFTVQTYDLSKENYEALLEYTADAKKWENEAPTESTIFKAIQIVTKDLDDIPSKTFQWSKMKLTVTRSGSIGKSGLPNLNIECRQMAVFDAKGEKVSGHRWILTKDITAGDV
uniref:Uncharacterized protein n=1 Tax=Siphoviridae sp. ctr0I1 TaxID=2827952 RepID=A0A8S5SIN6_9CAUD|nr:MAG TPA: hypothetical protein [Siphoviridae sp. ctr0I1]